ncbi:MAG: hypothetical protein GX605_11590 [Chloroflexi bacterium]|nr:hypothetical protein [Chloroflexota bacterium]
MWIACLVLAAMSLLEMVVGVAWMRRTPADLPPADLPDGEYDREWSAARQAGPQPAPGGASVGQGMGLRGSASSWLATLGSLFRERQWRSLAPVILAMDGLLGFLFFGGLGLYLEGQAVGLAVLGSAAVVAALLTWSLTRAWAGR